MDLDELLGIDDKLLETEALLEIDDIIKEIQTVSKGNHNSRCGLSHQICQKVIATQTDDEQAQIFYLVDSHVPSLREKAAMRYERMLVREECETSRNHLKMLKDIISTKCSPKLDECINEIKTQIAEMPKEWTIVQITSQYNPREHQNIDSKRYQTSGLHISVFNCGQSKNTPFLITVEPPSLAGNKLELMQELMNTIEDNTMLLLSTGKKRHFISHREREEYFSKQKDTEMTLKEIVKKIEENWLREWRCLFFGKYQDDSIEQQISFEVDNILRDQLASGEIVLQRSKELLYRITKAAQYLYNFEILRAVQYCLSNISDQIVINDISRLIKEVNFRINNENPNKLLRHPVILVVDESLDSFPWEMMDVLKKEPISRVPSLHFAYFLFKAHEREIEGGHKIIKAYKNGKYIVNPDGDLAPMEARMMGFYNYWLRDWTGINNRRPTNDEFHDLLKGADIFSYSGHGNGTHIMTIEMLQKISVQAVVLLFGCASTRIARLGPQVEMYGSYHMYLISRCPCVLGMLWTVTDLQTDVLTTEFLSNWIPSVAPIAWTNVDKNNWKNDVKCGSFTATDKTHDSKGLNNLELLRALSYAKQQTDHYLTEAACVIRGLPVKIKL